MKSTSEIRAAWLAQLHSTAPTDRPRAEAAVRALYAAAGFPEPRHVFWFESPCAAAWPVTVLVAEGDRALTPLLAASALSKEDKGRPEKARAEVVRLLGVSDWKAALAAVGASRVGTLQVMKDPSRLFSMAFLNARYEGVDDISGLFKVYGDDDDLSRAESNFIGGNSGVLGSAIHCATAATSSIRNSFVSEYSFSTMADDEHRIGDRQAPPILTAAWEVARSAGLWWPFENAVFLSERPAELHVNERKVPHRDDGPAIVYRDGWRVYAWNGKAVYEHWIMAPETLPKREYQGSDPTFKKFVESKGKAAEPAKKRAKPGSILEAAIPSDPVARLEELRAYAGGRLPLYDRYVAGEHRQVWSELVALGAGVREDPTAADALAVAYETMHRVDANVRTLVERLTGMHYVFNPDGPPTAAAVMEVGPTGARMDLDEMMRGVSQSGALAHVPKLAGLFSRLMTAATSQPAKAKPAARATTPRAHVPPGPNARKDVADFEKEFGVLPLSLRAFYEVVGEVNLNGTHPALDPKGSDIAPDPLIVYGLDEGIVEFGEDEETPSAVTIAPDDLHKANTSGGDPYEMAIPDLRVDGELLNERHGVFFVDYLRLCFKFGGFPGYEGHDRVPAEVATLSAGLVAF